METFAVNRLIMLGLNPKLKSFVYVTYIVEHFTLAEIVTMSVDEIFERLSVVFSTDASEFESMFQYAVNNCVPLLNYFSDVCFSMHELFVFLYLVAWSDELATAIDA